MSAILTVIYTAKQKLFKQFTTELRVAKLQDNCYLYCEAETFQAIHNQVNHNINMSKNNLTVKIQPFHITYIIKYIV